MGQRIRNRGEPEQPRMPTAADFTGGAVQRAVLKYTLQHPTLIYPAAVAAVSVAAGVSIGFSPALLAFGLFAGGVSAASGIVNFVIRGETIAVRYVEALREQRQAAMLAQVEELRRDCRQEDFDDGAKEASELQEAFVRLKGLLTEKLSANGQDTSAQRYLLLAEDAYRQGVAALRTALLSYRARREIDESSLRRELKRWERERDDGNGEDKALLQRIESHKKRLARLESLDSEVEELLAQSNSLEGALEQAFIDISRDRGVELGAPDAVSGLERAMEAARRVEERLRGSQVTNEDDNEYLAVKQK